MGSLDGIPRQVDEKMSFFSGFVQSVRFENVEDSLYILQMRLDQPYPKWPDGTSVPRFITLSGNIFGLKIQENAWLSFEAIPTQHSKYGWQLKILRAPVNPPRWDTEQIVHALEGMGIQPILLQILRQQIPDDELVLAIQDPDRLSKIAGFTEFSAKHLAGKWSSTVTHYKTLGFLQELGLSSGKIKQIWKTFGDDSYRVLSQDPWQLIRVDGITFNQADSIASRLGMSLQDEKRLPAAVLYGTRTARQFGHLYVTSAELMQQVLLICPQATKEQVSAQIKVQVAAGLIKIDRLGGKLALYEPWFYTLESESAKLLHSRQSQEILVTEADRESYCKRLRRVGNITASAHDVFLTDVEKVVEFAVMDWESQTGFILSEKQKEGVHQALLRPVSVLTGLPGSGKSSSVKAVVQILSDAGFNVLLVAPTGIAAKRLTQVTGKEAKTIHMAFSAKIGDDGKEERESSYAGFTDEGGDKALGDGQESSWGYGAGRYHDAEYVVIDESSMLDAHLLYRVLNATSPTCRLLFVGDPAQLPSVGPGDVLRSLIKAVPSVFLNEIFRQKGTSAIVEAAHKINAGIPPEVQHPDFLLTSIRGDDEVLAAIIKKAQDLQQQGTEFQCISPRHSGTVGVTNLNQELRKVLNPPDSFKGEISVGSETLREGDRVMVVKNDYKYNIANGDTGKVHRIDRKAKNIVLSLPDMSGALRLVEIPQGEVSQYLRLAYASTVHKCVAPETWVTTDRGHQQIQDINPEGFILTERGFKPYLNFVENPETLCYKITTESGLTLTMSEGHDMIVWVEGQDQRVQAPDLRVGDILRVPFRQDPREAITKIERVISRTMCVEVPDGHTFIQNGLLGGNCQGQEFSVVIMPMVDGFRHQLQRNLFYTAITRAKKQVFLFGTQESIHQAVLNDQTDARNTLFGERLVTLASQDKVVPE